MTCSQLNSANVRFVNSCYTNWTVTKADLNNELPFCGAVGEPNDSCSEDGSGHLGCPGSSQTSVGFFLR